MDNESLESVLMRPRRSLWPFVRAARSEPDREMPVKIGVVLPNWVGDVAMATPFLRAVRAHWGQRAVLTGIMRPYASQVLEGLNWLDECLLYDPRGKGKNPGSFALVCALRKRRLDAVVLLTNSLRTGFIAWLSGARCRIGYSRSGRGALLSYRLQPPREGNRFKPISPVDYYLKLAAVLGCPAADRRLELATTAADAVAAEAAWVRAGFQPGWRVIALNTGGAYGSAKHWPPDRFAELARRLADHPETGVLMLCGPAESAAARQIECLAAHPRVKSLCHERLSIGLSKACIRRSQLLITTDSGPRHFAAAFGVPCIALFGPTDPRWSWNYHPGETVLQADLPCVPCARRTCPLGHHQCMTDLTVAQVYTAACRAIAVTEPGDRCGSRRSISNEVKR